MSNKQKRVGGGAERLLPGLNRVKDIGRKRFLVKKFKVKKVVKKYFV